MLAVKWFLTLCALILLYTMEFVNIFRFKVIASTNKSLVPFRAVLKSLNNTSLAVKVFHPAVRIASNCKPQT